MTAIAPWLSVPAAAAAADFYTRALGAEVRERLEFDGTLQVAGLAIGDAEFWVQHDPGTDGHRAPDSYIHGNPHHWQPPSLAEQHSLEHGHLSLMSEPHNSNISTLAVCCQNQWYDA